MVDIISIVLFATILVLLFLIRKQIGSSIQKVRDQVDSLHQQTSGSEWEIMEIRREVRDQLRKLDTRIAALETQIEASINTFITSSEPFDHTESWWTTLSNDAYNTFIISSERFDRKAKWWRTLSRWYREQRNWTCEECALSLHNDKHYLHTHHIWGTRLSTPQDLRALCIGCHAEEPRHNHVKEKSDYQDFINQYGEQWRRLRSP